MARRKIGRPKTGRTFRLAIYITPLAAKSVKREAKERRVTPGQILEEAYQSRAMLISKPGQI